LPAIRETAICVLKRAVELDKGFQHGQVKCLNNRPKPDHGALKLPIDPTRDFKTLPTASACRKWAWL
jgi:transposase-like protein